MDKMKEQMLDIVQNVGGKDNISLLTHCVTRLRFVLNDESLINEEALKQNELVKGCFSTKGQYQVIIGPGLVDKVYDLMLEATGVKEASRDDLKKIESEKMNPLQRGVKIFSDVFYPILPAIVGAGLLLGVSNLLSNPGIFNELAVTQMFPAITGLADMISMIANTAFTYIPVLVAWSATKRFGGNPMLGVLLGLVLINENLIPGSQMSSVISGAVEPKYWNIFGIDILKLGYQNSVLPALVASFLMVKLELSLKKRIPDSLQLIFVAPIAIFVTAFLTFLCIGPATNQVATWITDSIIWMFDVQPILAGFVFAFMWEPLVVTGMHHALIAVAIQIIASTQNSPMVALITIVCVAEAGAVFAMSRLAKTKNEKSVAVSAGTAALLGVTEPSMFGVTIAAKFPFLCAITCAGITGALMMMFGVYAISLGPSGPLSFTIIPAQLWPVHYMCMAFAFVSAFASTYVIGKSKSKNKEVVSEDVNITVYSPIGGKNIALSETSDPSFASEALGKGFAIIPNEEEVVSPIEGTITVLFPTKHAIGITDKNGLEILIHIGIDTVQLVGEGFETFVEVGQTVKKGEKLVKFDSKLIKSKGYDVTTFVVVTNTDHYKEINHIKNKEVKSKDAILSIA